MHQILIVEDDPALSQGIRLALGQEGRQFVQAGTIGQAERELAERTFDLLILDLNLPDGNGLDLLSRLRDRSALPVLILTANDLEMDQVTGLELGADDYVTKPFSLAVLRARVNSLLRRSRPAPAALELPPFLFDFDAMVFARDGVPLELSKTEQRLLRLLVEHRGQTLSREVLLDRVWDGGEFVDENALSVAVNRLRAKLAESVTRVQLAASLIAQLDTLCSFAAVAVKNNYCRPCVDESGVIEIQAGRHPVVEKMRSDALFVPNDTLMGAKEDRVSIITGPNMAGKSTYMRQVALIVLMAQVGSFVPAHDAHIGVVDRIFTRIGASDDLSAGQSTFMVEMTEVSDILRTATKNSLLILDEIGRGTSTFDGMSIARAVLEHCAEKLKAKTLFATHYHELTALEQTLPNVRNYNIAVRARGEDIIFLRKIVPGGADRSYGIEVAKLAGLPDSVLKRARAILEELESQSGRPAPVAAPDDQLSLTAMAESEVAELLRRTQVDSLSPLEALNLLYDLKKRLGNG